MSKKPVGHRSFRQRLNSLQLGHTSSNLSSLPSLSQEPIKHNETSHNNDSSNIKASLLKRTFRSNKKVESGSDDIRGPLGLRTLFSPPEPLIDLVFVHGLRGGSIKTFCKDDDPELFWPKIWLPMEAEFSSASIHSFGYDSDWGSSRPSSLTVLDFGLSLYEELQTSPLIRHNSKMNRPIILIGHSMGGLVIKKAYNLAEQDITQHNLSGRIRCLFFLATPHRGSDYADLLNGALGSLSLTSLTSSKDYVNDLKLDSVSMKQIHEEFAATAASAGLMIYTFYEIWSTLPITSTLIVKKNSAVVGENKNEHIQYLEANHRDVCKFASRKDSNYVRVKNALATAVESLLENVSAVNAKTRTAQLQLIKESIGSLDLSQEYHDILEGSCRWIEDREDFQQWGSANAEVEKARTYQAELLWVQAQPGAGKTMLSAHVASLLVNRRPPLSRYFFQYGNKARQSLRGFLLSLAYQMATNNEAIREKLAQLCEDGSPFYQDNIHMIWTKIFDGGIFQVPSATPQFWIMDGLDECVDSHELTTLLNRSKISFPLRIFVTSRNLPQMQKMIQQLTSCKITVLPIPTDDTMRDIVLYINMRIRDIQLDREKEQTELARRIREKCTACFLWVRLVMDELEQVYGFETMSQVLDEMPEGMLPYYKRAVAEMAKKREIPLAKAILNWTVLATRPLSVTELSNAVERQLKIKLSSQRGAIEGLCAHLVSIDRETNLVQVVHATATEFLISQDAGNFQVLEREGHETIASICILAMSASLAMVAPKGHSFVDTHLTLGSFALLDYATIFFSDHVFAASASSRLLLQELYDFLEKNILTWIATAVTNEGLQVLIKTAKNLKGYLDRRAGHEPLVNSMTGTVDGWATDLSRISSKFGHALVSSPDSIFFLIPPLCPTQSTIYQKFANTKQSDALAITGSQDTDWNDCLAHMPLGPEIATAIAIGSKLIAVGTQSGNVILFSSSTHQKQSIVHCGSPVRLVNFDLLGSVLVVSSGRLVAVYELDGNMRWKIRLRSRIIMLSFPQNTVIGVTEHGRSYQWDEMTGEVLKEQSYIYRAPDSDKDPYAHMQTGKAPLAASISPDSKLIAFSYRNSPVCVFDFGTGILVSWIIDEINRAAEYLSFNPNPETILLAVAYDELHLAVYEPCSGALVSSMKAENPAIPCAIACSPDGRNLAVIDIMGHLRVWDFESLQLLYHILTPMTACISLDFTLNGTSLVSLENREMRIWAPSSLDRNVLEAEARKPETTTRMVATKGQYEQFRGSKITVLVAQPKTPFLFSGSNDGDVLVYSGRTEYHSKVLYSHGDDNIRYIAISSNNLIAVADLCPKLQVRRLRDDPSYQGAKADDVVFKEIPSAPYRQLLFDESGEYLLVSTLKCDYVLRTSDGNLVGSLDVEPETRKVRKWIIVPSSSIFEAQFVLVEGHKILSYSIEQFPALVIPEPIGLDYEIDEGSVVTSISFFDFHPETSTFILELRQRRAYTRHSTTFVFKLLPPATTLLLPPLPQNVVKRLIGFNQVSNRLMFLHQESWICSIDPQDLSQPLQRYTQHFLLPNEYVSVDSTVNPVQTADGDFAFCIHDKVAVVKNGLKYEIVKELDLISSPKQ